MSLVVSPMSNGPVQNTDRELYRERPDDYYADSLHVTADGAIGINVGGHVIVKSLKDWFRLASPALTYNTPTRSLTFKGLTVPFDEQ